MNPGVIAASAALAAIAAAGVLRPFGRSGAYSLEPTADPLEDERDGLLRSLRELDDEQATGALAETDYRELRRDTERRAVAVLRALEARGSAGEMAAGLQELRPVSSNGSADHRGPSRARSRLVPALAVLVLVAAVAIPLLVRAEGSRRSGQAITGDATGPGGPPLSFFEQRVRAHPNDVAARLDLAARYQSTGLPGLAVSQYVSALRLDPRNVEAHTELGLILYGQGRTRDGLRAVQQALRVDPSYPEALYAKGLILMQGLHRKGPAAAMFRAYLAAAPFGSHREQVQELLTSLGASAGPAATAAPNVPPSP